EPIELVRSSVRWRKKFVHRANLPLHSVVTSLDSDCHVILYGMPGVGKSELAAQVVAHGLESHKYRAYFWIRANSKEQIVNDYIRIATTLGFITQENTAPNEIQDIVRRELNKEENWLLVFENLDFIQ